MRKCWTGVMRLLSTFGVASGCMCVPIVGTVLNTSPMCNLYKIVVFPAASSPSITTCGKTRWVIDFTSGELAPRTRISLLPHTRSSIFLKASPMSKADSRQGTRQGKLIMLMLLHFWYWAVPAAVHPHCNVTDRKLYRFCKNNNCDTTKVITGVRASRSPAPPLWHPTWPAAAAAPPIAAAGHHQSPRCHPLPVCCEACRQLLQKVHNTSPAASTRPVRAASSQAAAATTPLTAARLPHAQERHPHPSTPRPRYPAAAATYVTATMMHHSMALQAFAPLLAPAGGVSQPLQNTQHGCPASVATLDIATSRVYGSRWECWPRGTALQPMCQAIHAVCIRTVGSRFGCCALQGHLCLTQRSPGLLYVCFM